MPVAATAISVTFARFAQVFSQILHVGLSLRFEDLLETMTAAAEEIRTNQRELEEMLEDKKKKKDLPTHSDGPFPAPAVDRESLEGDLGDNIHTFLYVVVIYTKVKDDLDEEQRFKAMKVSSPVEYNDKYFFLRCSHEYTYTCDMILSPSR